MNTVPDWLRDLATSCPTHGAGVHQWLFRAARQLHAHYPGPEIIRMLAEGCKTCGRRVPPREIVAAVQDALGCAWQPNGSAALPAPAPRWPAVNGEQRAAIVRDGPRLADLWESSPVRFDDPAAEEIVAVLFPGNPLLCCGKSSREFATRPREDWFFELGDLQLITPSPMTAPTGLTRDGRQSAHSLANTGPRRFLVIEFDHGTADEHAALLWHLAGIGPLALVVSSGGKSLHGWFYCAGEPEEKLEKFMRLAVSLGADPATWTRSQFVRMPDGRRENGKRQTVYYFSPGGVQ